MRSSGETIARGAFLFCAGASAVMTASVFLFMIALGLPLFRESDFFSVWSGRWSPHEGLYGVESMISGTLWIALLATALSLPLSLGTAIVITSLGGLRLQKFLNAMIRFMTGIPTVIYGFVGIFLLVPLVRGGLGGAGLSVLAAGIMLAIMISPTMTLFFSDSLLAVDPAYVQAAKALGADRVQRLLYVMLPKALGGMTTGLVLALGRALGDTLIALMLAGNAIGAPESLLDPARTLTAHIALVKAADYDSLEFRSIFACGIALYLFTTVAVIVIRLLSRKKGKCHDPKSC
ncbi:MAG: ABC transporter permease subunit [Desulfobacteraceae bacterium]|jgi:phosphate transport system permease protein|nr:ABC transporter permease subunit [Desulfobacteraceae bacterium]